MNPINYLCVATSVFVTFLSIILILIYRSKTQKTMESISNMLSMATEGHYTETVFDESLLSSLEAKFSRYLTANALSSNSLSEEKDKIKQLISDISHQTKTPITDIILYSQLLSEHTLTADSLTCTTVISAQAEKLSFLISSLVKISRLETGIIKAAPKPQEIQMLLNAVQSQAIAGCEAKHIQFQITTSPAIAWFDLKWTTEAIFNIVDNGIKYTQAGGKISISVLSYELFCRIDIADNGIGIAEEEQSKIFTRFYRSTALKDIDGVGIGLFLAREIISSQGGYIKVASALGKGTTFSVFLPREHEILQNC